MSYIPDDRIQFLRELTRYRTSLFMDSVKVKTQLRHMLAVRSMLGSYNRRAPDKWPFGPRGLYWFSRQDFGAIGNGTRDHLLERRARTHLTKEVIGDAKGGVSLVRVGNLQAEIMSYPVLTRR